KDWRDVLVERGPEALREARAAATPWKPTTGTAAGALPQIVVLDRPLRDKTTEAIAALERANEPPAVFVRGGRLVRVRRDEQGRPGIDLLGDAELRGHRLRARHLPLRPGWPLTFSASLV